MTVGWQAGDGDGEPPPSKTGGGCGGVLQPASAIRGDGGPGSGDDVLVSAADSPSLLHRESTFRLLSLRSWNRLMLSRSHGPRLSVIIPIVEVIVCSWLACVEASNASSGPSLSPSDSLLSVETRTSHEESPCSEYTDHVFNLRLRKFVDTPTLSIVFQRKH